MTCGRSVGFFRDTQVSSTNKTDCHDITEMLLKVVLNTITITLKYVNLLINYQYCYIYTDSRIVILADFDLANIGFPDSL